MASTGTEAPGATAADDPRAELARSPMSALQVAAVGIAAALNALDGFDVLSISFASPGIAADWGVDRAALGVVLSMELIGMAAGAILFGMVADRIGRRPTVLACLVVMAGGMALAAGAGGVVVLSAYRLLTGLGIGGMLATTNAVVAEFANARRRNLCIAIMGGGYPVGAVVGGTIAAHLLAGGGSWHSIFHFGAIATACFIPLVWFLLPETLAYLIQARPAGALGKVNALLARMGRRPVEALPEVPAGRPRGSLVQLFAPGLASVTILLTTAYFLQIMTFYFLLKWIPKIIVDYGFPAASAAGVLVWANVGGASGSLLLSLLTQRVSVRLLTAGAMVCGMASVVWFGHGLSDLAALSLAAGIAGFFLNGANVGLYAMFAQSFPARLRASGTGFIIGIGRGGAALGPIVAGLLFSGGLSVAVVSAILACGSLLGSVALMALRYREDDLA